MVSEWYLTEWYSEWSNGILNGTYKKLFSFFVNDILNGIPFSKTKATSLIVILYRADLLLKF